MTSAVQCLHVISGLEIHAEGNTLVVQPGECDINGQLVCIAAPVTLPVEPAPIAEVTNEPLQLCAQPPVSWHTGTRLQGPVAGGISAIYSFIPDSLVIRRTPDGEPLVEGKDYLVSPDFAMLGVGPDSCVTSDDTVYASYRYAQMRLDTVFIGMSGSVVLKQGAIHTTVPLPPDAPAGFLPLANIYRPFRATEVTAEDIYTFLATAEECSTGTTAGRIPRTLAKLQAVKPVTIVCWGDSVTNGGDASSPEKRYVDVFAAGLRERFPQSDITVVNASVDGSSTLQWLYPEEYPPVSWQKGIDFSRVTEAKPDLITLEFVNDTGMDRELLQKSYAEVLHRFAELDAECILITPHFTHPQWMGLASMRGEEGRDYVRFLHEFAETHQLALADASARWQHLWQEGLPYLTLLKNSLNHPDDRGHRLFAEELWKCFEKG